MRLRLILSFILIVIVSVVSVALVARRQTVTAVNAFIHRGGLSGTEGLVRDLEEYYATYGTWEGVDTFFQQPGRGMGMGQGQGQNRAAGFADQRLQLADVNGLILVDTQDENPYGRFSLPERNRAIRLEVDEKPVGYLLPETRFQISQITTDALVSRVNRAAFTAAIFASVVALALALYLSYRLLRPVGELTRAAHELAAGDLSQRVPVRGGDELGTLANSFNHMAASLQLAETRRRALTADIAHELRTPLAVQRAHLEALEDGIYELTYENLKPIEEHNRLLTRLVDDLRMLALADSGQLALVPTPTDFPALIKRVVARMEPQAAERQIQIHQTLDGSPPLLSLDAQRIEQILHNLLDNALRFTPDGGVIRVQLSVISDQCFLTVRDNGPGIPPEDLPRIFERFYRADRARSRADGGTGLGLSIARKIAQAHGGDLIAENHPEGGAVFTLILPNESESSQ
jgi:signal transduction histidine kinase